MKKVLIILWLVNMVLACSARSPELDAKVQEVLKASAENMVFVKGGTFMIGDTGDGKDIKFFTKHDQERNAKEITLDSYHISKYEVTWGELTTYMKDIGEYSFSNDPDSYLDMITAVDDPLSVYYHKRAAIAPGWHVANDYCNWLGKKTGLPYALPTEAQWEYAARSRGKRVRYANYDGFTMVLDDYMYGLHMAWNKDIREKEIHQSTDPLAPPKGDSFGKVSSNPFRRIVGSYPPNPLGLYDMAGNNSEWVADWYQKDYYPKMASHNPKGPKDAQFYVDMSLHEEDIQPTKVVRDSVAAGMLIGVSMGSVYERLNVPIRSIRHGFRCALNLSEPLEDNVQSSGASND